MSRPVRRLRMFAGPNGSGKSTIVGELLRTLGPGVIGPLVVADDIEVALKASGVDLASFGLAPAAATLRAHLDRSIWLRSHAPTFDVARDVALTGTVVTVRVPRGQTGSRHPVRGYGRREHPTPRDLHGLPCNSTQREAAGRPRR